MVMSKAGPKLRGIRDITQGHSSCKKVDEKFHKKQQYLMVRAGKTGLESKSSDTQSQRQTTQETLAKLLDLFVVQIFCLSCSLFASYSMA